jgi:HSP20 family protein
MTEQTEHTARETSQTQASAAASPAQRDGHEAGRQTQGNGQAAVQGPQQMPVHRGEQKQQSQDLPTFIPPADVVESKEAFMVLLDVPGADPQSLDITLDKHVLTVSAKSTPWQPEGYVPVFAEYQDGNYSRSFILSDRVDENRIEANFRDGVLRLNLPKAAPAPAKKIQVSAA